MLTGASLPKRDVSPRVQARRRGEDHLRDAAAAHGLEDVQRPLRVGAHVDPWVFHAGADSRPGGEIVDRLEAVSAEQIEHLLVVLDVHAMELEGRPIEEILEPRLLQGTAVVAVDVVDSDDGVAALEEHARDARPYESGGTCDKICRHGRLARRNTWRRMSPSRIALGKTSHSAQQPGHFSTHFRRSRVSREVQTESKPSRRMFPTTRPLN